MDTIKSLPSEDQMPDACYNIQADFPTPLPPVLHPGTGQPITLDDLAPLLPMSLIAQEISQERWIEILDEVQSIYRQWRPTPLRSAKSHKPNTAVAQAYDNKQAGVKRSTTETGVGQWGAFLAFADVLFGLENLVYMMKVSYNQKPYRRASNALSLGV
jgi:tryptophan synthase beta chain